MRSTPIKSENQCIKVTPYKKCPKIVSSPLRNAYFNRTPIKSGVVLPLNKKKLVFRGLYINNSTEYNFGNCTYLEGYFEFTVEE